MHEHRDQDTLPDRQIDGVLDDLEIRCATGVDAVRHVTGSRRRTTIAIRPGNVRARAGDAAPGETTEIRRQGLTAMTTRPLMVGDIFHVSFDAPDYDANPVLAMCDRCTMLGDESFEVRFRLAHEPDLPEPGPVPTGDDNGFTTN